MLSGRAYIYQAAISDSHNHFHGVADFLVKVPGASSLGDYHYEPWDTKLALKPKPYYIIQLCCYAEILQSIQAVLPATISVVLGSKETKAFRTEDYYFYYKQLKARFLTQQAAFDPSQRPTPSGLEEHGRWSSHQTNTRKQRRLKPRRQHPQDPNQTPQPKWHHRPSQNMSKSAKAKTPGAASPSCHRRHPTTSGSTWRATPTCKAA